MKSLFFIAGFIFIAVSGYSKEFFESRMEYWNKSPDEVIAFEKLSGEKTELLRKGEVFINYAIIIYDTPCRFYYYYNTNDLVAIGYKIPKKLLTKVTKSLSKYFGKPAGIENPIETDIYHISVLTNSLDSETFQLQFFNKKTQSGTN